MPAESVCGWRWHRRSKRSWRPTWTPAWARIAMSGPRTGRPISTAIGSAPGTRGSDRSPGRCPNCAAAATFAAFSSRGGGHGMSTRKVDELVQPWG